MDFRPGQVGGSPDASPGNAMELNLPGGGGLVGLFRELCDFRQPAGEEGIPDEGALRRGRSELIDFPLF